MLICPLEIHLCMICRIESIYVFAVTLCCEGRFSNGKKETGRLIFVKVQKFRAGLTESVWHTWNLTFCGFMVRGHDGDEVDKFPK